MIDTEEDMIVPTPTAADSKKITAIDRDTVHRICSGQVVLNLAIAVKELVENSIDAGATVVEVKLKDYGAELVEVVDNGSGVEQRNFEGMTAKYHTSKLREFSDLAGIETFGFRGEALSSLCALADMVIVTRHETAPHGTKLELNHRGVITKRSPIARAVGTTVSLSNLFSTLPVRKKEFQKNVKKEFFKMSQILQAYCLVSTGVRIICTNQKKKGQKEVVMSTQGTGSVLDNITTVFGTKQAAELVQLKQAIGTNGKILDLNESDFDENISMTQEEVDSLNLSRYTIEGYISSCAHGSGRSARDRQFFFVNSRPCEPKQIIKLVNETYHKYNASHTPFVFLNLKMDRADVDVNLTPDKRQLLMNNEKILLLALKKSLLKTFGNIPSTFKMQNLNVSETTRLLNISFKSDRGTEDESEREDSFTTSGASLRRLTDAFGRKEVPPVSSKRKRDSPAKLPKIDVFMISTPKQEKASFEDDATLERLPKMARNSTMIGEDRDATVKSRSPPSSKVEIFQVAEKVDRPVEIAEPVASSSSTNVLSALDVPDEVRVIRCRSKSPNETVLEPLCMKPTETSIEIEESPLEAETSLAVKGQRNLEIDMSSLKELVDRERKLELQEAARKRVSLSKLKFKCKINPNSNRAAEDELQMEITKEKFGKMEIIGQFNLGFIIARLDADLFIIDQHATDEKYNFEDLQRNTVLQNQKLVVPQPLELTAVNEMILMDSLEIFEMNGFQFEVDGGAEPTKKIKLVAKPFSKNWEFGKEDIDELIFMLQDAVPNTVCRPSRVRSMFASRACRKSVMIGKALTVAEMRRLVTHMGEIEQPWVRRNKKRLILDLLTILLTELSPRTTYDAAPGELDHA
ncbi:DNA mismatch repair protein pms1 [Culex quinquefasciatus]|uniref:DNA mismatch repair protein pms1 n=1 Tax=Culex quinquefasciatus TaxID=7176 RepID=B0XBR6_CULQU|nr:DNA mismatch repair protein pms1 [Culex quinquefasciatus]|eukprot:XP_001867088.1 DNA mismatch repair protein pms1 [Culex quinquefasciatus]